MNLLLVALLLGIIQGITEFLPISSTGHLIIANQFFSLPGHLDILFMVVIQLGAILSVIFHFRDRLVLWRRDSNESVALRKLWKKVVVAILPVIILGSSVGAHVEEKLFHPWIVAITLFSGGVILVIVEKRNKHPQVTDLSAISYQLALSVGLIQCLAIIPGTSRSATTIIGAMLLGCSRVVATEFSFFLAIPTMAAAAIYGLIAYADDLSAADWLVIIAGFLMSFFVALLAIRFLLRYAQRKDFKIFGYYRIALAILIVAFLML